MRLWLYRDGNLQLSGVGRLERRESQNQSISGDKTWDTSRLTSAIGKTDRLRKM